MLRRRKGPGIPSLAFENIAGTGPGTDILEMVAKQDFTAPGENAKRLEFLPIAGLAQR